MTLIECVPNFSEGRRLEVVDEIVAAIAGAPGVTLLDRQSDGHHNRSVITFVGEAAAAAGGRVSRRRHRRPADRPQPPRGRSPALRGHRRGALRAGQGRGHGGLRRDRAPARRPRRRRARHSRLLLRGRRARPERRNLADVRRGEFEGLRDEIGRDPARAPDEGPAAVHPQAGAVAIGARPPLIAYNVNLESADLELARRIAGEIRERDGGLPCVKAIGLALDERRAGLDEPDRLPAHLGAHGLRSRAQPGRGGWGGRARERGRGAGPRRRADRPRARGAALPGSSRATRCSRRRSWTTCCRGPSVGALPRGPSDASPSSVPSPLCTMPLDTNMCSALQSIRTHVRETRREA